MSEPTRNVTRRGGIVLSDQRGVVVPIVTIGLLALLAVAGLALDGSHALANKTRMQNTTDAAALAAAKVLDQTEDTALATAAAVSLFGINADGAGNHELNGAYDGGEISVTVQYSETVVPFTPGSPDGPFVRVIATGFDTLTTLSRVLGIGEIPTPATAVAGPSGPLGSGEGAEVCDVAPIAVCGESEVPPFGFELDSLIVLKPAPGDHADIGPGNYKMLRMDCNGDNCLRHNLAGSFDDCIEVGAEVETEPGVGSGPTSQGFNTRFGKYRGGGMNPDDYPPDRVTRQQEPNVLKACEDDSVDPPIERIYLVPEHGSQNYCLNADPSHVVTTASEIDYSYNNNYVEDSTGLDEEFPLGSKQNRRVLVFPVINCDGEATGQSTLDVIGTACLFMLQELGVGQADSTGQIFGQFVTGCKVKGTGSATPDPGPGPLLYKIQLYDDPDSRDS